MTDRATCEGTYMPADGHAADCWDDGCSECQLHALTCTCDPCNAYRLAHFGESLEDFLENLESDRKGELWTRVLSEAFGPDSLASPIPHTLPITLSSEPTVPAVLSRNDGATLLYEGRLNTLFGEPGTGKTWVAIMTLISAVRNGAFVAWWDHEDRPATLAARL